MNRVRTLMENYIFFPNLSLVTEILQNNEGVGLSLIFNVHQRWIITECLWKWQEPQHCSWLLIRQPTANDVSRTLFLPPFSTIYQNAIDLGKI